MATDLRVSVSLVLAGLAVRGETVLNRVWLAAERFIRFVIAA